MASAIIERKQELSTQDITNTLWTYATLGLVESPLLEVMAPRAREMLSQYNSQGLSNIAWSYAVANVNAPSLFDKQFTKFVCDQMDCLTTASCFGANRFDEMTPKHWNFFGSQNTKI